MKVVVLHDRIPPDARPDVLDGLVQAREISAELTARGHVCSSLSFSLDYREVVEGLSRLEPDVVFNLVESVDGQGRLLYLAPALLDSLGVRYTGAGTDAMFMTTNKVLAKRTLAVQGVPTPAWQTNDAEEVSTAGFPGRYILKLVWEEASVGLGDDSIVEAGDAAALAARIAERATRLGEEVFAERFIEGREFNLSMWQTPEGPRVLPAAEIRFVDYPPDKPRIVGYAAKWDEGSFEYHHTPRVFDFAAADAGLLEMLQELALRCWSVFDLRGYARVDFRVDEAGRPWVLEVNANPCLSRDAGFMAAAGQAGFSPGDVVEGILLSAARGSGGSQVH